VLEVASGSGGPAVFLAELCGAAGHGHRHQRSWRSRGGRARAGTRPG
jgi:hypothetical protein